MGITILGLLITAQSVFAQSSRDSDIPNYSLMWEYPMVCVDGRNNKEYVCERKDDYYARLDRAKKWTQKVYEVISRETKLADLKASEVEDVDFYCPNYGNMSRRQKIVFWGQFVAAISYKESSWRPTTRTLEPLADFPKPDSVTGERVYSEGLMQLSYQDGRNYSNHFDCAFDWKTDKKLKRDNANKTILAPYRNLRCGILILNHKVNVNNKITTKGQYWSVIRPRAINKYSKTLWISEQTKKLPFCNR